MRKRASALLCGLLLLALTGCTGTPPETPLPSPIPGAYESVEGRQIRLTADEVEVRITLNDSRAAADLAAMLPLEFTVMDRNGFAKAVRLPRALVTDEETTREYEVGDFGYWPPGPDLAIFYDDFYEQTVVPIIPVGHAECGAEDLWDAYGTVRMELVPLEEEAADAPQPSPSPTQAT